LQTIYDEDFTSIKDRLSIALSIDYRSYLQDDILCKVDRATMSVALEGREPFLDHRIIEFVAQLPTEFKYDSSQKRILKEVVHDYIPKQLMDRPKIGFSVPVYSWLKGDLSFLLEEYLDLNSVEEAGVFNASYVQKLKQDFIKGRLYDPLIIWKILSFQMWFNQWMK